MWKTEVWPILWIVTLGILASWTGYIAARNVEPRESGGGYGMIWLFYFVVVAVTDFDLLLDLLLFPGYKTKKHIPAECEFPGFHLAITNLGGNLWKRQANFVRLQRQDWYNVYKMLARSYKTYKTKIVRATKPMRRNIWVIRLLRSPRFSCSVPFLKCLLHGRSYVSQVTYSTYSISLAGELALFSGGGEYEPFGRKLLLMEEIPNNHLGWIQPCKEWDKLPTSTSQPDFFHQQ